MYVKKCQDLNHLDHCKYFIPKLCGQTEKHIQTFSHKPSWWVSVFFQRQGHTSSQSPLLKLLQSFSGSQRENTAWKGVKNDLSHLWLSHTSDLNGSILAPGTDLILKRLQSQVSLWHISELNCMGNFEVRA